MVIRSGAWVLAGLLGFGAVAHAAGGYVYRAPDGTLEFTDVEKTDPDYQLVRRVDLDDRSSLTVVSELPSWVKRPALYRPIRPAPVPGNRLAYTAMIEQIAQETGLKAELLHAVIRAESAYDPGALSPAGAGGLMQLMPGTADRYGVRDRFDPAQNLRGGARYLRDLLQMFDRNLQLALAGYNAGENAVIQYDRTIPPYAETQQYVKRVLQYYVEEHQRTGTAASLLVRR
jgi:soluble lytic murein transglycosylase-like protein